MLDIRQLKYTVSRMAPEDIREAVEELRLEGLVTDGKTPFGRLHFNTCLAEIEALLQRAGYHRQLDVVGYQGLAYALFDPARWEAVEVLRWLRDYVEEAHVQPASCAGNANQKRSTTNIHARHWLNSESGRLLLRKDAKISNQSHKTYVTPCFKLLRADKDALHRVLFAHRRVMPDLRV